MDFMLFTDNWFNWFFHEYAFAIALIFALLKCFAILDKGTASNQIVELLQNLFNRKVK